MSETMAKKLPGEFATSRISVAPDPDEPDRVILALLLGEPEELVGWASYDEEQLGGLIRLLQREREQLLVRAHKGAGGGGVAFTGHDFGAGASTSGLTGGRSGGGGPQ